MLILYFGKYLTNDVDPSTRYIWSVSTDMLVDWTLKSKEVCLQYVKWQNQSFISKYFRNTFLLLQKFIFKGNKTSIHLERQEYQHVHLSWFNTHQGHPINEYNCKGLCTKHGEMSHSQIFPYPVTQDKFQLL